MGLAHEEVDDVLGERDTEIARTVSAGAIELTEREQQSLRGKCARR